ncbi:MAG: integration host factor subunit beta [Bacteroidales bacterium]|nr:integration host factor subunit beta [Bacteroidales bacterium]
MTKAEIVAQIAKKTGLDKETVLTVVEQFMMNVKDSLVDGEPVYLRGFGSFIIKERATKTARNIKEERSIIIPAHNIPAFKPAKSFMGRVSGDLTIEDED